MRSDRVVGLSGSRRSAVAAVLAVLLLAGLTPASAFAAGTRAGAPDPDEPVDAGLLETAQERGTVRVIVTLRGTPATAGPSDSARRRGAIGALQQDVLARLPARTDANGRALTSAATAEARGVRTFALSPGFALDVTPAELDALLADPDVAAIDEDRISRPHLFESGTRIGRVTSGPYAGTFHGHTGEGWAVAILDSGVNRRHFALRRGPGILHEACFSTDGPGSRSLCGDGTSAQIGRGAAPDCSMSLEGCGHGTHVASTAAAMDHALSSTLRLRSVAHRASIVAVQVFSAFPFEAEPSIGAYDSDIVAALEHLHDERNALGRPLAAVNLSLGGAELYSSTCDGEVPAFTAAATALQDAGVAVVAASGNDGSTVGMSWPACVSSVISVGSTRTADDAISEFTNSSPELDLMAPGEVIVAAYQSTGTTPSIDALQGTSMAAPHVAGAFAVLREADPGASVDALLELLEETGTEVSNTWWTGPRIDLAAAVAEVATASPPTRPSLRVRRGVLQAGWRGPARGPVLPTGSTLEVDDGSGWRAVCDPLTPTQRRCAIPAGDIVAWGVPHAVRVRTESDFQPSTWLSLGTATPYTVPDASAASLTTTPSPGAITVSWSGLGSLSVTRGAPVTRIQVRATPASGPARSCTARSGRTGLPSSCTVRSLPSGVSHTLDIRMRNAAGWSAWATIGSVSPG